jgi:hypothetical protein
VEQCREIADGGTFCSQARKPLKITSLI